MATWTGTQSAHNLRIMVESMDRKKARGGFYTPADVVEEVLARTGCSPDDCVLEPSCGDGAFLAALAARGCRGVGVEMDAGEARKAALAAGDSFLVVNLPFQDFAGDSGEEFDLVVGNPPYVRYQSISPGLRDKSARLCREAGFNLPGTANAWVSFVVLAASMVRDGGRMGLVVPQEIMHCRYAPALRSFLASAFGETTIVLLDYKAFPEALQSVALLVCRDKGRSGALFLERTQGRPARTVSVTQVEGVGPDNWRRLVVDRNDLAFFDEMAVSLPVLGDLAKVSISVTTGANGFFLMNGTRAGKAGLSPWCEPAVSKALPGLFWDGGRLAEATVAGSDTVMLATKGKRGGPQLDAYLRLGVSAGIDKKYKCRTRSPWHAVPSGVPAAALMTRRNGKWPMIAVNGAGVLTTDSIHRVSPKPRVDPAALAACFATSLCAVGCELSGRSHSGGALELLPAEAMAVHVPWFPEASRFLPDIDRILVRSGQVAAMEAADDMILGNLAGMGKGDVSRIRRLAVGLWTARAKR